MDPFGDIMRFHSLHPLSVAAVPGGRVRAGRPRSSANPATIATRGRYCDAESAGVVPVLPTPLPQNGEIRSTGLGEIHSMPRFAERRARRRPPACSQPGGTASGG